MENSEETENPEECEACNHLTADLKFCKHGVGYPDGSGQWLCNVCRNTISSIANRDPHYYKDPDTIRMIAQCTNLIIDEIRKLNHKPSED